MFDPIASMVGQYIKALDKKDKKPKRRQNKTHAKRLTQADVDKIFYLHEQGVSVPDIEKQVDASITTIRRRIASNNRKAQAVIRNDENLIRQVVLLRHSGMKVGDIAKKLGIAQSYASKMSRSTKYDHEIKKLYRGRYLTQYAIDLIFSLSEKGYGATRIARETGISKDTIVARLNSKNRKAVNRRN